MESDSEDDHGMQSDDESMKQEEEDEVWSDEDMDDITYEWDPKFFNSDIFISSRYESNHSLP